MTNSRTFPSAEELQNLPICDRKDALKYYADENIKLLGEGKSRGNEAWQKADTSVKL